LSSPSLQAGRFLIANPTLRDPNFSRTVVLLCEHGDEGSMGVIINRPTEHTLTEAITGVPEKATQRLYWGGPVQQRMVLVLHRHADDAPGTAPVSGGMALGTDHKALIRLLESLPDPARHVRVYSGYAGWAAGQLDAEMQQRSWIVASADPSLVFDVEPDKVWRRALQQLGPRYAHLTTMPADPRVN
jgi:putative transcriptional regulator